MIKRFALSNTEYTPIIAPVDCDYYSILGEETGPGKLMKRCSDPNDAASEYTMRGPYSYACAVKQGAPYWEKKRFAVGTTLTYLKMATDAAGEAIVEFSS